ncbi:MULTISPECIES: hypothetical protein [Falsihalocynthiibacter]|uniref:EF-hand domain-containing protein n=1 Tax=Falsihalocynthiibacter arcticus TaxID=1579316 RepID=A0A126V3U4_9RHOB|nr:hypothetical protein [Falsihalocynthiibacter arcticus]AML52359.1 hypothetical protein RC74_14710 [Falsihalocynthiibacter arcticus]
MKNVILVAALATSFAFSANAMNAEVDTDGDGMASLVELQVSQPDLTDVVFNEIDTDGDGFLNDDEMAAAIEAGTLMDPEADA